MTTAHMLESQLEALLRKRVQQGLGGMLIKLAPTQAGVPDRLVLLPGGGMHLVELKTTPGKLSAVQQAWHARAARLGVTVQVLYGATQVIAWVRARAYDLFERPDTDPMRIPNSKLSNSELTALTQDLYTYSLPVGPSATDGALMWSQMGAKERARMRQAVRWSLHAAVQRAMEAARR